MGISSSSSLATIFPRHRPQFFNNPTKSIKNPLHLKLHPSLPSLNFLPSDQTTMAASVATAAVGSPLVLKCAPSTDSFLFLACHRIPRLTYYDSREKLRSCLPKHRSWRIPTAAVAQEEVASTAETEEKVGDGSTGEEGGSVEVESASTKLYFGNLPYNVDSAELAGIIQDYGSPELIEVLYDRNTGRSRGFAFVTMSNVEDCNLVIENLDGREYMGRTLRVNFSDKPEPKEPLYPETEYKLFVGNLSWSATSESLTKAFQEYGNVVGARVLYDGETGRSRGYGFVSYSTKSEMDNALESLNGAEIEGRAMRVSLAQGNRS